ncbi:MAG: tRNA pseudouridine(38-40) synthase TruA [Candidatus Cloacimonetes bacterium]|nr:tRNA pseudouridine(38-40) synthase TruA [Candidatus Cloacimonadota bacterium]
MKQKFLLNLAYDGTFFHGWQVQKNVATIQQVIESALKKIFKVKTNLIASGRTDAGVHAINQYAHFSAKTRMTPEQIVKALNSLLPDSIYIKKCKKVEANFHSRFDASERIYLYKICKKFSPFIRNYAVFYQKEKLDISLLNKASKFLLGEHDFEVFAKDTSHLCHCVCEVRKAEWQEKEDQYLFYISANRFLHNMVRRLLGTYIRINNERLAEDYFLKILKMQDLDMIGTTAPAHGLYLYDVKY